MATRYRAGGLGIESSLLADVGVGGIVFVVRCVKVSLFCEAESGIAT